MLKDHWNEVYSSKPVEKLGWYEPIPTQSLKLIKKCDIKRDEAIIDVGCGVSTLIHNLLSEGYRNIIATDISDIAISKLKKRLGNEFSSKVKWIIDDLSEPKKLLNLRNISLWHDRAVLHFLTDEEARKSYLEILTNAVKLSGYVIIAAFSLKGAKRCSGLDIKRYDERMLSEFLGNKFTLIDSFDYTHRMPSGDLRPYIYTLFQKDKE
ncbi:MAG: methyltransferase domain-containing protein [Candidatus Schekmanbacteria bacterium]|nr:MAG: methyltransferase domain-containing protein [Candidatus Schekmanbacteria bacterium]